MNVSLAYILNVFLHNFVLNINLIWFISDSYIYFMKNIISKQTEGRTMSLLIFVQIQFLF